MAFDRYDKKKIDPNQALTEQTKRLESLPTKVSPVYSNTGQTGLPLSSAQRQPSSTVHEDPNNPTVISAREEQNRQWRARQGLEAPRDPNAPPDVSGMTVNRGRAAIDIWKTQQGLKQSAEQNIMAREQNVAENIATQAAEQGLSTRSQAGIESANTRAQALEAGRSERFAGVSGEAQLRASAQTPHKPKWKPKLDERGQAIPGEFYDENALEYPGQVKGNPGDDLLDELNL